MANILIVDDDRLVTDSLRQVVEHMGHTASVAASVADALRMFPDGGYDIVFCDVRMPDGSGLDILPRIRDASPAPEVIIITGYGDPDGAELAIRKGAWDYVEKPLSVRDVMLSVERALQYREKRGSRGEAGRLESGGHRRARARRSRACLDALARRPRATPTS